MAAAGVVVAILPNVDLVTASLGLWSHTLISSKGVPAKLETLIPPSLTAIAELKTVACLQSQIPS